MQTLYIDIYFFINFTVDLIGLHLASEFNKIKISFLRLVLFSLSISAVSVCEVFISHLPLSTPLVNLVSALFVFLLPKRGVGKVRRLRFLLVSYIFLMLIGGLVYAVYSYMKKNLPESVAVEGVNRKILMLSIIVLIAVGAVKIFVSLMKDAKNEKCVRVTLFANERCVSVDSFVDTGNFLKDPIDGTPVMLLKKCVAKDLFPYGIPTDMDDSLMKKYGGVRLVPVNQGGESKILLGFKPRRAIITTGENIRDINAVFVIDEEGGSYGGYNALVPPTVIE